MELEIQKWVRKTKPFDKESEELFNEAVECYRVGANRAAFIMSYLAYEKTLQSRILKFDGIPSNKSEEDWEKIKEQISNEDYWEKNIFHELEKKEGIVIFPNRGYILAKLKVYKHTRNACVHGNNETINASIVEEFWTFLKDNIFKFTINGRKDYFKKSILNAFKYRNDNIDITYEDELERLAYINLSESDLIDIWKDINSQMLNNNVKDDDLKIFWDKVLLNKNSMIKQSFIHYISIEMGDFIRFYTINPDVISFIMQDSIGLKFKNETLYNWIQENEFQMFFENKLWGFIENFSKNYIHKSDEYDFFNKLNIDCITIVPSEKQTEYLKQVDFFEIKRKFILDNLTYDYDNVYNQIERIDFIVYMIKNYFDDFCMDKLSWYLYHLVTKSKYTATEQLFAKYKEKLFNDKEFILKVKNSSKYYLLGSEAKNVIEESMSKLEIEN